MIGFQFVSIRSYARVPSRHPKASKGSRSASAIIAESRRAAANSTHVERVETPVIVAGAARDLMRQIPQRTRPDARILIGAVDSFPERWDRCDPLRVCNWIENAVTYFDGLWPEHIAVVMLHTDEGYPHLHFLAHDGGERVVHLDPGACAREEARKFLLASGLTKSGISKKILDAVRSDAMTRFQDHHYAAVSSAFGIGRKSGNARSRVDHELAINNKKAQLRVDPVDERAARKNKDAVRDLLADRPIALQKKRGVGGASVLAQIGFDVVDAIKRPVRSRNVTVTGKTRAKLRTILLQVLAIPELGWPAFISECSARDVVVIPFVSRGVMRGISFRHGLRAYSGSKLGADLSWVSLRSRLGYDPTRPEDRVATAMATIAASRSSERLFVTLEPTAEFRQKRRKPWTLSPLGDWEWPEGAAEDHVAIRRTVNGRTVLEDHGAFLRIVSPNTDVLRVALRRAASLGWGALNVAVDPSVKDQLGPILIRLSSKQGIEIRLAVRGAETEPSAATIAHPGPSKDIDERVNSRRPRP